MQTLISLRERCRNAIVAGLNDGTTFINVLRNSSSLSSSSNEVIRMEDCDSPVGNVSIAEDSIECSFLSLTISDAEELELSISICSSSKQRKRLTGQMDIQYDRDTLTVAVHRVVIVHVKDSQRHRTIASFCRSSSLLGLVDRISIVVVVFVEREIVETRTHSTFSWLRCGAGGSSFRWHNRSSDGEKRGDESRSNKTWVDSWKMSKD